MILASAQFDAGGFLLFMVVAVAIVLGIVVGLRKLRGASGKTFLAEGQPVNPSRVCPCCRSTSVKQIPSRKAVSVSGDRQCESCGAKWSPPISKSAAVAMMFFCAVLAVVAVVIVFSGGVTLGFVGGFWLFLGAGCVYLFFKALGIFNDGGGAVDVYERPTIKDESKP